MPRHQFGSPQWVEALHGIVRRLLSDADLAGIEYSSSEEYLDPPQHLATAGGVGWHLIVRDARLTLGHGPLQDAERVIRGDYRTIEPMAALSYRNDPQGEAKVMAMAVEAASRGLLSVRGARAPSSVLPQLAGLHDLVADITAPPASLEAPDPEPAHDR